MKGPGQISLSERLTTLVSSSQNQSAAKEQLEQHINALHVASLDVEGPDVDTKRIKKTVEEAFRLTVDGFSLADRLE